MPDLFVIVYFLLTTRFCHTFQPLHVHVVCVRNFPAIACACCVRARQKRKRMPMTHVEF